MDKSLRIALTVIKEDKEYTFSMPYGASHGEAYDACYEVLKELIVMAQDAVKNSERKPDQGDSHVNE